MDIYNITTPFGLLDDETKAAIEKHIRDGGKTEFFSYSGEWEGIMIRNTFGNALTYRAVRPAPTPDIVPWDTLADWVEWVARDEYQSFWAYEYNPEGIIGQGWSVSEGEVDSLYAVKIIPGTCDWRDSLQRRPNKGETK